MKTCTKCGLNLEESNFHKNIVNGKTYLQSQCKECKKKDFKKYYAENKEHFKQKSEKKLISVRKRCPECKKHFILQTYNATKTCPFCHAKLKVSKTLGSNPKCDNAHGIRLKVIA